MSTSPLPTRVPTLRPTIKRIAAKKAADLESMAQLIEHSLPNFKKKEDRKFYRDVVESYRSAAHDVLRRAWFDDKGQDIAEYAVMGNFKCVGNLDSQIEHCLDLQWLAID